MADREARREPEAGTGGEPARSETPGPDSVAAALARARRHARLAVGEALAAVQALVDAASIGWSGLPREAQVALRNLSDLLDEQSRGFRDGDADLPIPVMTAVLDALDQEIGRWEKRATRDPDARAVLRTFLGLREILWEFGFRRNAAAVRNGPAARPRAPKTARKRSRGPQQGARAAADDDSREDGSTGPATDDAAHERRTRVQRVDVQG